MSKRTVYDILFILIVAAICHILFSKYGFNPTDEGFVLSATNRVLHGQIPHVDFSSVRPLGYAYLHIPELLISKTHFFLVSRFVFWLEQALIAFLWIRFLVNYTKTEIPLYEKYIFIFFCFVFNVHYFPCSVLHTIDGLLMCMIGLNIISAPKKWNFIGFFFIGFAALCKQNYLVVLPVILFLFNRKNIVLNFLTGFFPIAFYIAFVCLHGGYSDLTMQLTGHNELIAVGVFAYFLNPIFLGVIFLSILFRYLRWNEILLSVCCFLSYVLLATNHYHGKYSFILFAYIFVECGIGFLKKYQLLNFISDSFQSTSEDNIKTSNDNVELYKPDSSALEDVKIYRVKKTIRMRAIKSNTFIYKDKELTLSFITLLLAWCVSISVGYNTPALFLGGCLTWCLFNYNKFEFLEETPKIYQIQNITFALILLVLFVYTRYNNIYRDSNLKHLTFKLDNIVEGASGIYTNKNTYDVLQELDSLKKSTPHLVVIPDFTACNILHSHQSKILTEWPNKTEIPNDKILKKITSQLNNDSTLIFAIPVFQTALLKDGFTLQKNRGLNYPIVRFVKEHFQRVNYSNYFELRSK